MNNGRSFVLCVESTRNPWDGITDNTIIWKFELIGLEKLYQQIIIEKLNDSPSHL